MLGYSRPSLQRRAPRFWFKGGLRALHKFNASNFTHPAPTAIFKTITQDDINHLKLLGSSFTNEELLARACSLDENARTTDLGVTSMDPEQCFICSAELHSDEPKKNVGIFDPRLVPALCNRCVTAEIRDRTGLQAWYDFRYQLGLEEDRIYTNAFFTLWESRLEQEWYKSLPEDTILQKRNCYCKTPEQKFCGGCQVCDEAGHMCHYPGPLALTSAWCDKHYIEECRGQPHLLEEVLGGDPQIFSNKRWWNMDDFPWKINNSVISPADE